jgi:hypothetical protein
MKYRLLPQNEGQGMNLCRKFTGKKQAACQNAAHIAKTMQLLFPECTITCGVQTPREGLAGVLGIIVLADGKIIDGQNGGFIKI